MLLMVFKVFQLKCEVWRTCFFFLLACVCVCHVHVGSVGGGRKNSAVSGLVHNNMEKNSHYKENLQYMHVRLCINFALLMRYFTHIHMPYYVDDTGSQSAEDLCSNLESEQLVALSTDSCFTLTRYLCRYV